MPKDPAFGLTADEALARIGAELSRLSGDLRRVEQVLFPVILRTGEIHPGSPEMDELQRFDLTLQSYDGLADILKALATSISVNPKVDAAPLIAGAKLATLAARLLDRPLAPSDLNGSKTPEQWVL
jgi:hypothetical protein